MKINSNSMKKAYDLKLDDLLKSLTELGIDTDKLTIVEKSEKFDEQEFINDYRNSKVMGGVEL